MARLVGRLLVRYSPPSRGICSLAHRTKRHPRGLFFFLSLLTTSEAPNPTKTSSFPIGSLLHFRCSCKTQCRCPPDTAVLIDLLRPREYIDSPWKYVKVQFQDKLLALACLYFFSDHLVFSAHRLPPIFYCPKFSLAAIARHSLRSELLPLPLIQSHKPHFPLRKTTLFSNLAIFPLCGGVDSPIGHMLPTEASASSLWFQVIWFSLPPPCLWNFLCWFNFTADSAVTLRSQESLSGWEPPQPYPQNCAAGPSLLSFSSCTFLAHHQTKAWQDSNSLFTQAIKAQPRNHIGYSNLAALHQINGDYDSAQALFKKSLELNQVITWPTTI